MPSRIPSYLLTGVVVKIGPVHRHQDVVALADLVRHPAGEAVPHGDAVITEHPIDLLNRVLGDQSPASPGY